jgi:iron complex outermembrane receptor protein
VGSGIKQAFLASVALMGVLPMAGGARAQTAGSAQLPAPAPKSGGIEEVVVTARSRTEKLKDVPISISVLSSKTLDALSLTDTTQIANFSPSLQFSDFAPGYFAGRLEARPLVFRGLYLANNFGVTAASLVFLDGAPLLGTEIPVGLDIARVEVLRGPQSVYFGRSTLSGAVNYVTKDISNQWTGTAEVSYGSHDSRVIELNGSGPVIPDKLYVGIGGSTVGNGGYYHSTNPEGTSLGSQRTDSIAGNLDFTPTEDIKIKGFINYFEDNDGPPATVQLPASKDNCHIGGVNGYYCGAIPSYKQIGFYNYTALPLPAAQNLFSGALFPQGTFSPQYGVQRKALVMNLVGTWDLGFATLESRSAYEHDQSLGAENGQLEPYVAGDLYKAYDFSLGSDISTFSQELRLRSDANERFRWTAGGSFVRGYNMQQAIVYYNTPYGPGTFNGGTGGDITRSYGIFGGVYYDILKNLTLSLEARYQWDNRQGVAFESTNLDKVFQSFSPRLALDYKITPDVSAYVSYAKGTRPGGFNTPLVPYLHNPTVLSQLTAQLGPVSDSYEEESLKTWEIGLKGSAFEHRVQLNADFYYGELNNQQVANYAFVPAINNTLGGISNIGQTDIWGVEADGHLVLNDHISFSPTFAWNHTDIKQYLCTSCLAFIGSENIDGKRLPFSPEYSGSLIAEMHYPLFDTGWTWYSNIAYVYRGMEYIDQFNSQSIQGRSTVDLRGGVEIHGLTVEGFITNLTDNRSYVAGNGLTDFTSGTVEAFDFQVPPPRIFGARLKYHF